MSDQIAEVGSQNAEVRNAADPGPLTAVSPQLTPDQSRAARERLALLQAFVTEFDQCQNKAEAIRRIRVKEGTFYKWPAMLKAAGVPMPGAGEVLTVERAQALIHALAPGLPTGRPVKFALTPEEACALRACVLAKSTEDATHFALAVEEFANLPPDLNGAPRPEIRELIRAELDRAAWRRRLPFWPLSLRRAGMPNITEAAWFRGRKHTQPVEMVTRRAMFWIDEHGRNHPLGPHTIVEMDDASDNQPRQHTDPDTGEVFLTRQALWTQDVYSGALLALTQVARPRDAYRIEDVADHVLNYVTDQGLPTIMRLEMGDIWNGRFFHGFTPCRPNTTHVLPGWEDEKWGGLTALCRVVNVHRSKGKGAMEASFNLTQAIGEHRSLSIGRTRGEFEEATKALVRRATEIDERFWDMDTSSDAMAEVAHRFNHRLKIRRAFGRDAVAPVDLLRGAKGAPLLPSDLWMFCPVKKVATVRGGHVEISVDHYPQSFRFLVNGVDAQLHLPNGHTVLVAFHPGRPERGCHVFNAETGIRNRDGLRKGEKLILAPHAADVAQVDLSGHGDFAPRKKDNAAVRRNYRSITSAVKRDYAQDSKGRHLLAGLDAQGRRYVESHPQIDGSAAAAAPQPGRSSAEAEHLELEAIALSALEGRRD